MPAAVSLRSDLSAIELRRLAAATKDANQSRRLLSIAAVLDGMNRTEAARIGGMDRQTLRDWVHRFNEHGPGGLLDAWSKGSAPRLSAEQRAQIAQLVETGPDRPCMVSCAGGGSICDASSSRASGSTTTNARSAKSSKRSASPISAPAASPRRRTNGSSRRLKKLRRHAEHPSGPRPEEQGDRNLVPR